ncbi:MAG: DSD1 family PLP-dependent enzyme [Anaerolineae bacterium]|nr:MAG: DSD1 family PLP-dependent enzyme [Anaerolineae bacterium]
MTEIADEITKPTLLVDLVKVNKNIDRMVKRARDNDVILRPHFKTHQSSEIGQLFRERNVDAITVSSVGMAEYFAGNGWRDITVAFPVNPRQLEQINGLASQIKLNILFESLNSYLTVGKKLANGIGAWIKIDTGYHRSGILWNDLEQISRLTRNIDENRGLYFEGILTHPGHTYKADSVEEIRKIFHETVTRMDLVKSELATQGYEVKVSIGDTPGCSIVEKFGPVDEIRPGNFVFYDLMQEKLGACSESDIAVVAACPVVAKNLNRNEIVIYGGAVHLSKEYLINPDGKPYHGRITYPISKGWTDAISDCWLSSISQEHGVIAASNELLERVGVGDLLLVLPIHSCLTANLMGKYLTTEGHTIDMARLL